MSGPAEPVGIVEIAARLGVRQQTVSMWRYRGKFPEPRWTVGGHAAWDWPDIAAWADQTGRKPALEREDAPRHSNPDRGAGE